MARRRSDKRSGKRSGQRSGKRSGKRSWKSTDGTWAKEQPRGMKQKREQVKLCEKEGKGKDYCFLGGFPHYPQCTKGTCEINLHGVSAAQGRARQICRKKKSSPASKKRAYKALRRLRKDCGS